MHRSASHPDAPALPIPLSAFFGREHEIAAICDVVRRAETRLLTLTGPGGVGKSRLALRVAQLVADAFADGVCFVPLAPVADPALLEPAIAAALGLREAKELPPRDVLAAFLQRRDLLVILDNVEHLLAAAPEVAALLAAAPGLTLLATSRSRLRIDGELVVPVPPLAVPGADEWPEQGSDAGAPPVSEAEWLFLDRARAVNPGFSASEANLRAIRLLVRQLDGLPLAIELAAARANVLSPQAMLTRFERRLPLLTGGPRDQPERQRTLRDAIAWSHDLLSPAEQALFRRLAVFGGDFTLDAAEWVLGAGSWPNGKSSSGARPSFPCPIPHPPSPPSTFDGIAALVEASLLLPRQQPDGGPRFAMLFTVQEFAAEQLAASGEDAAARAAHAAWCLALAAEAEPHVNAPEARVWLDRLDAELDNVRAALRRSLDAGEAETALRLAGDFFWLWFRRHPHEGRSWLEQALALPAGEPAAARAKALRWLPLLLNWSEGDLTRIFPLVEAGLAAARQVRDRRGEAEVLAMLAHYVWAAGDLPRASALADEALAAALAVGHGGAAASVHATLGVIARDRGELAEGQRLLEEAITRYRGIGFVWSVGWTLVYLADLARRQERPADAAAHAAEAAAIWHADGDTWATLTALRGAVPAARDAGDHEAAAAVAGAVEAIRSRAGLPPPAAAPDGERPLAAARLILGDDRFAAAWATGQGWTVEQAIARVRAVGATPAAAAPRRVYPGGLSEREVEVLRLLAGGLSNAQIAERLFLSPHTVRAHLARIYAKLEIGGRAEAVRYAMGHDLV